MSNQDTYTRTRLRLEEIVQQVRSKDVPLEKSLDLYEEALQLAGRCAELIDRTDFSAEELEEAAKGFDTDEPADDNASLDPEDLEDGHDGPEGLEEPEGPESESQEEAAETGVAIG